MGWYQRRVHGDSSLESQVELTETLQSLKWHQPKRARSRSPTPGNSPSTAPHQLMMVSSIWLASTLTWPSTSKSKSLRPTWSFPVKSLSPSDTSNTSPNDTRRKTTFENGSESSLRTKPATPSNTSTSTTMTKNLTKSKYFELVISKI